MTFISAERLAQLPITVIENNAGIGAFRFRLNGIDETITITVAPNLYGSKFIYMCSHHLIDSIRTGVYLGNRSTFGSMQTALTHALTGFVAPYRRAVALRMVPEARWLAKGQKPGA